MRTQAPLALGALTIYDSPTMQALGRQFLDSWWFEFNVPAANRQPVVIQFPNLGEIVPPAIDVPLPELPPTEGDAPQNGGSCPNNVCPV